MQTMSECESAEAPRAFFRYLKRPRRRALARVVTIYYRHVWRVALRATGHDDDASDICQDVFLSLLLRPPAAGAVTSPQGYLTSRVMTLARRLRQAGRRRELRERRAARDSIADRNAPSPDIDAILAVLDDLPERVRTVFELRYLAGYHNREIAAALGLSERSVEAELKSARDVIRSRVGHGAVGILAALSLAPDGSDASPPQELLPDLLRIVDAGRALSLPAAGGIVLAKAKSIVAICAAALLLLAGGGIVYRLLTVPAAPRPVAVRAHPRPDTAARHAPPAPRETAPTEEGLPPPVDLAAADRELDLFGIVLDQDGQPVAGACVETAFRPLLTLLLYVDGEVLEKAETAGPATKTARDGTFLLRLRRAQLACLRVSHEAYGRTEVPRCQAGEFIEVALLPALSLQVVARDENGKAVPGAQVRFWRRRYDSMCDRREGVTNAEGVCSFTGMEPGKGMIEVVHGRLGSPNWLDVEVMPGGPTLIDVVLPTGRTIRGRVVDAVTGDPVAGARVSPYYPTRPVLTNAEGFYEVPGWTGEGVTDMVASAPGYGRHLRVVPPVGELDFELVPGYRAQGRIVDAGGKPVGGALVIGLASSRDKEGQQVDSHTAVTDAGGLFQLVDLRSDLAHTLIILAEGHGRSLLDFDVSLAEGGLLDFGTIVIPAARRIEGVAENENGDPLRGLTVTLIGQNDGRGRLRNGIASFQTPYGAEESRRTDDLGRFRFSDVSPGSYKLTLNAPALPRVSKDVDVEEDEDALGVVLRVVTGRSLVFVLRDEEGNRVPEITCSVGFDGKSASAATGEDGRAEVMGLPAKEVLIHFGITREWLSPQGPRRVIPDGQEVIYTVERAALIEGIVLSPEGKPLPGLGIWAESSGTDGHADMAWCDETGRFFFSLRRGSEVDLFVKGPHGMPAFHADEVTEFRATVRNVPAPSQGVIVRTNRVPRDRSVTVVVVDPEGRPVAEAAVHAYVSNPGWVGTQLFPQPLRTGAGGRVTLDRLFADPTELLVVELPEAILQRDLRWPDPVTVTPEGQEVIFTIEAR